MKKSLKLVMSSIVAVTLLAGCQSMMKQPTQQPQVTDAVVGPATV